MNSDLLIERYIRETHPWIDTDSDFFVAFSQALRTQYSALLSSIEALPQWRESGTPLRRLVSSWGIFYSEALSDSDLRLILQRVYQIHQKRGTIYGIDQDVSILLNYPANIAYYTDLEWYLGCTFPDQTDSLPATGALPDGVGTPSFDASGYGRSNLLAFGLDTVVILSYFNDTQRSDKEVERVILEEFCPVRAAVEFLPQSDLPAATLLFEEELALI